MQPRPKGPLVGCPQKRHPALSALCRSRCRSSTTGAFLGPVGALTRALTCFAAYGHPQVAVADGTVDLLSGGLGGTGIWLDSDYGIRYYYAHMSAYAPGLQEGQRVSAGDLVGFNGQSGNAKTTPPHLHFGIKVDGSWVNPFPTLARNC